MTRRGSFSACSSLCLLTNAVSPPAAASRLWRPALGAAPWAEACDALGCRYQGQLEALYTALEERQKARLRALKEGTGGSVAERVTQVCLSSQTGLGSVWPQRPAGESWLCRSSQKQGCCCLFPESSRGLAARCETDCGPYSALMTLMSLPGKVYGQTLSLLSGPYQASSWCRVIRAAGSDLGIY